jgi:tRNA1(Val) A37 N6-methylase TrmN6
LNETTEDRLLGGRVLLRQPSRGFRAALDPVLLAAFVPARPGEHVLEAGCGTGAAFLCLASRVPGLSVTAVERDAALAEFARANAAANGVAAAVVAASVEAAPPGPFHHAFANPPWWPSGTPSPDAARRAAGHEAERPLADWVRDLARRLRHRGTLSLILPAARFSEAAAAMRGAGLGAILLLPLEPRAETAAKICLIRGVRGGRGPDRLLPGLVLHEADGRFTPAAEAVLRGAAPLGVAPGARLTGSA